MLTTSISNTHFLTSFYRPASHLCLSLSPSLFLSFIVFTFIFYLQHPFPHFTLPSPCHFSASPCHHLRSYHSSFLLSSSTRNTPFLTSLYRHRVTSMSLLVAIFDPFIHRFTFFYRHRVTSLPLLVTIFDPIIHRFYFHLLLATPLPSLLSTVTVTLLCLSLSSSSFLWFIGFYLHLLLTTSISSLCSSIDVLFLFLFLSPCSFYTHMFFLVKTLIWVTSVFGRESERQSLWKSALLTILRWLKLFYF